MARLAARFFQQPHPLDHHAAVNGFAHVVNGQQGNLGGGDFFNKFNRL
jgi:hypothetical protein